MTFLREQYVQYCKQKSFFPEERSLIDNCEKSLSSASCLSQDTLDTTERYAGFTAAGPCRTCIDLSFTAYIRLYYHYTTYSVDVNIYT